MRRWIITNHDHKIGQANSWHRAMANIMRDCDGQVFTLSRITKEYYILNAGGEVYSIKLEAI